MIIAALAAIAGLNGALPPATPESHQLYPDYVLPAQFQGPVVYPAGYAPLFYVVPSGHYSHNHVYVHGHENSYHH